MACVLRVKGVARLHALALPHTLLVRSATLVVREGLARGKARALPHAALRRAIRMLAIGQARGLRSLTEFLATPLIQVELAIRVVRAMGLVRMHALLASAVALSPEVRLRVALEALLSTITAALGLCAILPLTGARRSRCFLSQRLKGGEARRVRCACRASLHQGRHLCRDQECGCRASNQAEAQFATPTLEHRRGRLCVLLDEGRAVRRHLGVALLHSEGGGHDCWVRWQLPA
mmetsp:Transcript_18178/g.48438  ORF Transcript_18178/g.48438 Transcript_18178/m.48438 type:complete len:234 (-) Transcript_18178:96-797(-)